MSRSVTLSVLCAIMLGGCATHPLPQDVSGVDTRRIVVSVRCEARDAIRRRLIDHMRGQRKAEPAMADLAERLAADPSLFHRDFDYKRALTGESRKYALIYDGSAIAYEFTLNMKETNALGGGVSLGRTFRGGGDAIGLGASNDRERGNVRVFRMTDNFADLALNLSDENCAEAASGPNYQYPMAGRVGLAEVISTFIDLNETGRLAGKSDKVPALNDTLTFKTTLAASVTPSVLVSPVGRVFELASATFTSRNTREDTHTLAVTIVLPPDRPAVRARRSIRRTRQVSAPDAGFVIVPPPTVRRGRTAAENLALEELNAQRLNNFLTNSLPFR